MATTYSAWTSAELDTRIASLKLAIDAAVNGKAYNFNGRGVTRQDLPELRKQMDYYVAEKNKRDGQGIRVRRWVGKR